MSDTRVVSTHPRGDLLPELRALLQSADEATLASAFVDTRGIHLLGDELQRLGSSCRLLATTVFGGEKTHAALAAASDLGVDCRILNPSRGTFHPKVTMARLSGQHVAMVGSANITAGLVSNVEAGVIVSGRPASDIARRVESWWSSREARTWKHPGVPVQDVISMELWPLLRAALEPGTVVHTVTSRKPNQVDRLTRAGLWVATERTQQLGRAPAFIEPRMLDLAWAALVADGELTNTRLLNDLRVHRSSFVCAVLAKLPGVEVANRRPIRLTLDGDDSVIRSGSQAIAAEHERQYHPRVDESGDVDPNS